jgi:ribonuclease G
MTRPCPTCDGEGVIKSEETIAIEFERRMRDLAAETKAEAILLQMNPRVSAEFTGNEARALHAIEAETGKWFHFEGSEGLPMEHFAVLLEGDREQVLERALPFREGEEVHVELVEPHMYSPGDAVAKVDGYIIAVKGADRFVGQKRLVRIEEVGRTAAVARLVDVPASEPEPKPKAKPARASSRRKPQAPEVPALTAVSAEAAPAAVEAAEATAAAEPETDNVAAEIASGTPGLDDDEPVDVDDGADGVESKPRRRGRRGGRRRSGARAETAAGATPASE